MKSFKYLLRSLVMDRYGNFGLTFALVAVPLTLSIGISFDFARAYNVRRDMQNDLDAAVLAAVNDIGTSSEQKLRDQIKVWFAAQSGLTKSHYTLVDAAINIDKTTARLAQWLLVASQHLFFEW